MLENIKKSALNLTALRGISLSAMFIALYVVLGLFKVPITPDNRISFTFCALVAAGYVLGPAPAALIGALGDIIGFVAMPSGTFFPGYTISAAITGFIFGIFLYKKPLRNVFVWLLLSRILVTVIVDFVLNTIWGSVLYEKAISLIVTGRIIKSLVLFPIQLVISFILVVAIDKTGIKKKY